MLQPDGLLTCERGGLHLVGLRRRAVVLRAYAVACGDALLDLRLGGGDRREIDRLPYVERIAERQWEQCAVVVLDVDGGVPALALDVRSEERGALREQTRIIQRCSQLCWRSIEVVVLPEGHIHLLHLGGAIGETDGALCRGRGGVAALVREPEPEQRGGAARHATHRERSEEVGIDEVSDVLRVHVLMLGERAEEDVAQFFLIASVERVKDADVIGAVADAELLDERPQVVEIGVAVVGIERDVEERVVVVFGAVGVVCARGERKLHRGGIGHEDDCGEMG